MNKIYKITSLGAISLVLLNPLSIYAKEKTETVYANIKYDGAVEKTTINTRLSELEKGDILDYSNLENITNINGKEKFTRDGANITWKSTGKDIYYKGAINSSLPIDVKVKYYFNGKEVTPSKIQGKSGNVSIEISVTNKDYNSDKNVYVPYVVTSSMILENDENSNINITNGKTISTGAKTLLTAISAPGLYESVQINELKDLDKINISYTTNNFKLADIYFVITPKLLSNIDVENINKLENTASSIYELQNGMNKLDDGAKKLLEGNEKIAAETLKLSKSLETLSIGQNTFNNNIQEIVAQVNETSASVMTLNEILTKVYNNNFQITEEDFNRLPDEVKATILNIIEIYKQDEELVKKIEMLNNSIETIYNLYELGVNNEEALINVLKDKGLDDSQVELLINVKRMYEAQYEDNKELIKRLKANLDNLIIGEQGILNTVSYYLNMISETSNTLSNASNKLAEGLTQAYEGSTRLTNAMQSLKTSTSEIGEGISKVNNEGISKISSISTELNGYAEKTKELVDLSNNYKGFASNDVDKTIFIYKLSMK